MAQRVYATASDYEEIAEDLFENPGEDDTRLNKRLRSASLEVDGFLRLARFDIDEDGYPTDTDVADTLKEATCYIVEYWEHTDDPDGSQALSGAVKIGSVSLGTTSERQTANEDKLAARIGTKAATALRNAGLVAVASY